MNLHRDSEIKSNKLFESKLCETSGFSKINDTNVLKRDIKLKKAKSTLEENDNFSYIKIINLRKNEHFGDVFMFLNNHSPLYARVRTKKAELLLLKKLDAVSISTTYSNIWEKVIEKS